MTSPQDPHEPRQDQPRGEDDKPRRPRRRKKRRPRSQPQESGRQEARGPRPESRPASDDPPRPPRQTRPRRPSRSDAPRPERRRSRSDAPRPERGRREDRPARSRPAPKPAPTPAPPPAPDASDNGFAPFGLPEGLLQGLEAAGYAQPTEIQSRIIPIALEGKDVVARSRTGTGKTCAFLMPALSRLQEVRDRADAGDQPRGPTRILVVTPTRELALQVAEESETLTRYVPVRTTAVYGGTRMDRQFRLLPTSAVVVGTPGRMLDHIGRGSLDTSALDVLVLDEVDRMYDLGFRDDVDRIIQACQNRRQTILVSATLNDDVEMLIDRHLGEHERIEIESRTMTVDEVEQIFYVVEHYRKRELLAALLESRDTRRTLIFTRTRFTADRVAYDLKVRGFDAQEIHSGLPQWRREQILGSFREGKLEFLVATDVAARGLDIQDIDHVINYDIPQAAEDYVHRVGRTARMGQTGWAVTLVCPDDGAYLTAIEKLVNKEIRQERFEGFGPAIRPVDDAVADDGSPAAAEDAAEAQEEPPSPGIPQWHRPRRKRR